MQEPKGFSGVQTVPKSLQSVGFLTPRSILGHSQPLTSEDWTAGTSNRFSASNAAKDFLICSAL